MNFFFHENKNYFVLKHFYYFFDLDDSFYNIFDLLFTNI